MAKRLPLEVKKCLEKSRDSALLAIETYNKPAVKFRTGGYVILMVIAWTSAMHAYFFRAKIKPFYREKDSRKFAKREGDFIYWGLSTCLEEYYKTDVENPVRKNLELFIPLRNKIEHKSLPEIDADLFAECQAMLLNFDRFLDFEFGSDYCMRESLSFSLQLFPNSTNLAEAVKSNPDAKRIKQFIDDYRSTISTEVLESGQYSFKAFLLQVANHRSADALPIQFIRYDDLSENEKKNVSRVAALVRYKERSVSGKGLLLPGKVVKLVQTGLGNPKVDRNGRQIDKFNSTTHMKCWKKYAVRPFNGDPNPSNTISEYCVYDELSGQYGYTSAWVSHLIKKMQNEEEFESL